MAERGIRLIGVIVVAAILLTATLTVALPLYARSLETEAAAAAAAHVNDQAQAAVDALAQEDAQRSALERGVAALRTEVPPTPDLLAVTRQIDAASAATGVAMVSFTPGDAVPIDLPTDGAPQASTAKEIPLEFAVSGPSIDAVMAFVDEVRGAERLLGDLRVTVSIRTGSAEATIRAHVYDYADPTD